MHRWSGLALAPILLISAITALPLIFRTELNPVSVEETRSGSNTAKLTLGAAVAQAKRRHTGRVQFISRLSRSGKYAVTFGDENTDFESRASLVVVDAFSGTPAVAQADVLNALANWHANLGSRRIGRATLLIAAVLLAGAIISGFVIYGPFSHRMGFGEIRLARGGGRTWLLDVHKLLSAGTFTWLLMIAITGGVNCLGDQMLWRWKSGGFDASAVFKPGANHAYSGSVPLDTAVQSALSKVPATEVALVAMPGSSLAPRGFYAVYLTGHTSWSSLFWRPAFVSAANPSVVLTPQLPVYVRLLLLSHRLHRGTFGGLATKLVWAALDLILLGTITSGVWLSVLGMLKKRESEKYGVRQRGRKLSGAAA